MSATPGVVRYGILGPLLYARDGREVPVARGMQRRILAALIINAGTVVGPDQLEHVLWDDDPPPTSRKTLHTLISRLRGVLGADQLTTQPAGYSLAADRATVDALEFERLHAEGRVAPDPPARLARLDEALSLWRGDALAEFRYEEFAAAEARRLDELRLVATEDRFEALLAAARHQDAVAQLEAFVAQHSYRERAHGQLMKALYLSGRTPDALAVYRRLRERLVEELGLDPSHELQELELRILSKDESLRPAAQAAPSTLRACAVPNAASDLVGRDGELAQLADAFATSRIVTITGPPGVGKTRLAMAFGTSSAQADRRDGVIWCELADSEACCSVGETMMDSLGLTRRSDVPVVEQLAATLAGRDLLLVLDSCERSIDEVAEIVNLLVRRSPQLSVLATSREPLRLAGERLFPLRPLSVFEPMTGGLSPALELFFERAVAARPDFELNELNRAAAAEICRRLDGLPLAIELVAADLRAFSATEVAKRLEDHLIGTRPRARAARHQTLEAAVDWSYSLLTEAEQRVFERLSVFAGGFDLASAAAITNGPEDLTAIVQGLVDRSLLTARVEGVSTRYQQLEVLRTFGQRRLQERGEHHELLRLHARWAVELAEALDERADGAHEAAAVSRFDQELANFRTAHLHAVNSGDADVALRLSVALHNYAFQRLRDEVFSWTEASIRVAGAPAHPLYPSACGSLALGFTNRWDLDGAERHAEAGLNACREDDPLCVPTLDALALIALERGQPEQAIEYCQRTATAAARAGSTTWQAFAQLGQCHAYYNLNQPELAAPHLVELQRLGDTGRNPSVRAWAMVAEAVGIAQLEPERAGRLLQDAIQLARPVHNDLIVGIAMREMADIYAHEGDPAASIESFRQIIAHWQTRGDWAHQLKTMRSLVSFLVRVGSHVAAAELLGAVRSGYSSNPKLGPGGERLAECERLLVDSLGHEFAQAVARGGRMDRYGTVAFARDALTAAARRMDDQANRQWSTDASRTSA